MKNLPSLFSSFAFVFLFACTGADAPPVSAADPSSASTPEPAPPAATPPPSNPTGPLTCDPANMLTCRTDADCACGSNLASGACAVGTSACIDTTKQCPDFCTGIDGHMTVTCSASQCVQVHQQ